MYLKRICLKFEVHLWSPEAHVPELNMFDSVILCLYYPDGMQPKIKPNNYIFEPVSCTDRHLVNKYVILVYCIIKMGLKICTYWKKADLVVKEGCNIQKQ